MEICYRIAAATHLNPMFPAKGLETRVMIVIIIISYRGCIPGRPCSMMPMGMPSAAKPIGMLSPGICRGQSTIVVRV